MKTPQSRRNSDLGPRKGSSLELRQIPLEDSFLLQFNNDNDDSNNDNNVRASTRTAESSQPLDLRASARSTASGPRISLSEAAALAEKKQVDCLRATCLRSTYSLRTQLLLSFGSITTVTIGFVIMTCIVVATIAGNSIQQIHQDSLTEYLTSMQVTSARFLAEQLSPKLIPIGAVNILYEATLDRFAGYPVVANDSLVPFVDRISQTGIYPVQGAPLPLDWQITQEKQVTEDNYPEHLQQEQRWKIYKNAPYVSTATAFYGMQGMCDPLERNPNAPTFSSNCNQTYNNITTGGIVNPTSVNSVLHRKASDLTPLLKALYEYHTDLKDIGIYFANEGAGAHATFPHYLLNTSATYVSEGCDWMASPNPKLAEKKNIAKPIAIMEEIRRCRPNGTVVSARNYNPLERQWCQEQAMDPNRIHIDGPYWDAWDDNLQLMTVGRSVYDRVTNEFLACLYLGITLASVEQTIQEAAQFSSNQHNGTRHTTVVRWDERGTVVATSQTKMNGTTITVDQLHKSVGVSPEIYHQLYSLVDFEGPWDPQQVQQLYESHLMHNDFVYLSAYPIPPIPETYDPYYRPDFLVILSLSQEAISRHVENVNDGVDEQVQDVVLNSIVVGFSGLAVVLLVIFIMAHSIALPLQQMGQQAEAITGSFGGLRDNIEEGQDPTIDNNDAPKPPQKTATIISSPCTPRTELTELTEAFEKMVASFSGTSSLSRATKRIRVDVENAFSLRNEIIFEDLYQSRQEAEFAYQISDSDLQGGLQDTTKPFLHQDHIVSRHKPISDDEIKEQPDSPRSKEHRAKPQKKATSPLFVWVLLLIGIPLLITTIIISVDGLYSISNQFLAGIDDAKGLYMEIELEALSAYTKARAELASSITSESVRDLDVLTRYASWLHFGGLEPRDSFTTMKSGSEVCKFDANVEDCSYFKENYVCDCAWNDITTGGDCQAYDDDITDTRYLQHLFYDAQNDDALQDGDRNFSSYPSNSKFPNATNWWLDIDNMPGSEMGTLARGHDTPYARLRMASANPMHQVLYNYDVAKQHALAQDIGYEADGMFMGFNGCRVAYTAKRPFWKSSKSNGGAELRPELCPLGKHGYDPRCREWYDTGRQLALEEEGAMYITPPYKFSSLDIFAHSATKALMDPISNQHVGQVVTDFRSDSIYRALEEGTQLAKGGFPILITSRKDEVGKAETVIGPGFTRDETARPIVALVMAFDQNCTSATCQANINAFQSIVTSMQEGGTNSTVFRRSKEDGSQETVFLAYAPVLVRNHHPTNSSDFTRGVKAREDLVYSLALAETEDGALKPFEAVENSTEKAVHIAIGVLAVAIALAVMGVFYLSLLVARSITEPMALLLGLIMRIKTMDTHNNHQQIDHCERSGFKEVVNFSMTLETLYSVVRNVNMAYFSGDLEKAYYVMSDSLRLFRHLDNKKAIGVACNNLGNIIFAAVRRMQRRGETELFGGRGLATTVTKGVERFTEAIRLGEKAYDEFYELEGWTPNCLAFMQHLSNRYFNRAMFILAVKDEHKEPEELEKLGLRDLQIAFDMDVEITDQGEETGWGRVDRDQQLLEVALLRARGHILLQEMGYPDDWEVDETLDKAFKLIKTNMSRPRASGMFNEMGRVGRLQQIETELMRYKVLKDDIATAAKIAIRILVEDLYVLASAYSEALNVLSSYVEQKEDMDGDKKNQLLYRLELASDDLLATLQAHHAVANTENNELAVVRQSMKGRTVGPVIDASLEDYIAMDSVTMEEF